jgi:CBS domain-containing protein
MKVSEVMSRNVQVARPDQPIREVAKIMAEADIGSLPVGDNNRLVGMVTDRDITVRAVANGLGPDTPVREVMTSEVKYVFEDEDVDEAARNLANEQVHRLPVVDRDKRLVGILALADLAKSNQDEAIATAVEGISRPHAEQH